MRDGATSRPRLSDHRTTPGIAEKQREEDQRDEATDYRPHPDGAALVKPRHDSGGLRLTTGPGISATAEQVQAEAAALPSLDEIRELA